MPDTTAHTLPVTNTLADLWVQTRIFLPKCIAELLSFELPLVK
jgi:hypothetical protein